MTKQDAIAVLVAIGNHVDSLLTDGGEKAKLRAALNVLDSPYKRIAPSKRAQTSATSTMRPKCPELKPLGNPLQMAALAARERQRGTN